MEVINIKSLILLSLSLVLSVNVSANSTTQEEFLRVSQLSGWKTQLYLKDTDDDGQFSRRINDEDFYFTKGATISLLDELKATYIAMFKVSDEISDQHPICRFPSRFLFLKTNLAIDSDVDILNDCSGFSRWAKFERNTRFQVVKVDGYYGNPASSFGHLILRLKSEDSDNNLFDTSINYGARVPPGESTPVYIFKGLVGGYQASLADDDFYKQDLVYTQTEFRDMWNYELNLTREQRLQFVAHIWEMLGRSSTYYFLKNNCAFAVAEMMEFVLGLDLVDASTFWYPPVRLFHDLDALNESADGKYISFREYVPSQKKILASVFSVLEPDERALALKLIANNDVRVDDYIAKIMEGQKTKVLEALIEYYDYVIEGYPELGSEYYERRKDLIIARLRLPMGRTIAVPEIEPSGRPPGMTARSSVLEAGGYLTESDRFGLLGFTPYTMSPLDRGNPNLSELTLFKTELMFSKSIELKDLTLLRVSQRSNVFNYIPNDMPISWTLDLGVDCLNNCESDEGAQSLIGIGQTLLMGDIYASALTNISLEGAVFGVSGEIEIGLPERYGLSAMFSGKSFLFRSDESELSSLSGEVRYAFGPKYSLGIKADTNFIDGSADSSASANLRWHFR